MEITEVRVKLVQKSKERLRAFCSITFDEAFVVRDLKVIGSGTDDGVFVAMPSRKLCDRCPRCRAKNHLRARFCNECGTRLGDRRVSKDSHGRAKIHADVAHPINTACREMIQAAVLKAFAEELERSKSPEYQPARFDDSDDALLDDMDMPELPEQKPVTVDVVPDGPAGEYEEIAEDVKASDSAFSDYDSLIAELRQEAAGRHDRRRDKRAFQPAQDEAGESGLAQAAQTSSSTERSERRSGTDRREPAYGSRIAAVERRVAVSDRREQPIPAPAEAVRPAPPVPAGGHEDKKPSADFGAGLS